MQSDAQSNAITATPSPGAGAVAFPGELNVHEELALLRAKMAQFEATMAALPAALKSVFEAVTMKPAVEPSREIGTKQLIAILPPGMRSESTVYRGVKSGRFPCKKIGRRWVFDPVVVIERVKHDPAPKLDAVEQFRADFKRKRAEAKQQARAASRRQRTAGSVPNAASSHSQAGTTSTVAPSTDSASL